MRLRERAPHALTDVDGNSTASSCRTTRRSPTSSRTSSASMSTRRRMRWCCRSTRSRQIQALDRTQPGLPMKKGRAGTMTHDYKRNGTTTLFAALERARRHGHRPVHAASPASGVHPLPQRASSATCPAGKLDPRRSSTTTPPTSTPRSAPGSQRHPRWTFHFTPTSCSWLNAVEGFFAKLTRRRLKRGVFHSIVDLQAAINRFLAETQRQPQAVRLDRRPRPHHRRRQAVGTKR